MSAFYTISIVFGVKGFKYNGQICVHPYTTHGRFHASEGLGYVPKQAAEVNNLKPTKMYPSQIWALCLNWQLFINILFIIHYNYRKSQSLWSYTVKLLCSLFMLQIVHILLFFCPEGECHLGKYSAKTVTMWNMLTLCQLMQTLQHLHTL